MFRLFILAILVPSLSPSTKTYLPNATMGSISNIPFRVLIAGGSYAGLSAALNLQDLCRGKPARCGPKPAEGEVLPEIPQFDIDVTIIDERDGFCTSLNPPTAFHLL